MLNRLLEGVFGQGAAESIDLGRPRDPQISKMFGLGTATPSGVSVDHTKVLALPAVMRAANIISNGIKKLPFYVFRELEDGREWDRGHIAWDLVTRKPNKEFTIGHFKKTLTFWAMLHGNGCAYIKSRNWPQGPVNMVPLSPLTTSLVREVDGKIFHPAEAWGGRLYYITKVGQKTVKLPQDKVFHIRGLGTNPYWGLDIVDVLRNHFGGSLAIQEHSQRFFGQGANPAGFIEMPEGLEEESEENFVKSLQKAASGLGKAHRYITLEHGAKFNAVTHTPEQAQFLETKELDVRMLAMALGVKVHKLIDSANSAYKSLEQANQEHKDDDLIPWIDTWSEEMSDKLLLESEKRSGSHSIGCDDDQLEWVSFIDRAEGCEKLYNGGVIDKDEARRKMNYGPAKSSHAKKFRRPMNIGVEGEEALVGKGSMTNETEEAQLAFYEVSEAYLERIWTKLKAQATGKATKQAAFIEWANNLRCDQGPEVLQFAIDALFEEFKQGIYGLADLASSQPVSEQVASYLKDFEQRPLGRFIREHEDDA